MPGDHGVGAGQRGASLPDSISLGVLAGSVPRDVVDTAVAAQGRSARRSGGKLPPRVMVYFAMALALFAEDDYEEVMVRLCEALASWGCWDQAWTTPTSGGITQARARLGSGPVAQVFETVAVPVADQLTPGAWLGRWRLMAVDGFDWDLPDTPENVAEFGYAGSGANRSAFPKARVVTISECASHAVVAVGIGAASSSEQKLVTHHAVVRQSPTAPLLLTPSGSHLLVPDPREVPVQNGQVDVGQQAGKRPHLAACRGLSEFPCKHG